MPTATETLAPVAAALPAGLTPTELVGGLGGAIGSDFRHAKNQLVFVEYAGKLSTFDLFPASTIVSQGTATLKGTFLFDLDAGIEATSLVTGTTWDIFWEQQTTVLRRMTPYDGAQIVNIGVTPFTDVLPSALQNLAYALTPIPGNNDASNKLVNGDVFAVRTNKGNFAKVLVTAYGYNMQIQWVTYKLASAYNVIGTGYTMPEDVVIAADDAHAFVLERTGDLVKVPLATANRSSATVLATGLTAPQQLALDEAHNAAYVVEYEPTGHGRLLRLSLTPGGPQHIVTSTLFGATGLVLSSDLQYAFFSEQNTGGTGATGAVSRISLADGSRTLVANNLVAPFHLAWADDGESALLVAERDPANRISRIDLATTPANVHVMVPNVAFRPSSVALANPGRLLICCDAELESVLFNPFAASGPLLMGIGFIPFDKVIAGFANTTVDPTYFYQVHNVPFGGTLPLMVNHQLAANSGAAFFRVLVYRNPGDLTPELVDTAPITDEKWNGTQYTAVTTPTSTIAGKIGYLPIHPVSELFNWYNPSLGAFLNSTVLPNGLNSIVLEFVNATGGAIGTTAPLTIFVDNNLCSASITAPTLGGNAANPMCGVLKYTGLTASPVVMSFTASHPLNFANYSFTLVKGVNPALTPPSTSGAVPPVATTITAAVPAMLGTCTIAGFAESIYVAATTNNGWGSQSQYDASAQIAFVLAP